ncbi:SDR family oxidoreductase [Streptomyces luomodiensis]|uniref:SDR family oxidoreductase n=1 Tax=Streptomyces luomodiensis TaxID=3026192 RepID=A0ABY9URZ9_9ACTN|nr:SDR family oxidoreductase [Streptomyces sp. SCA4-21]WNE95251.1 SDR family oxidoreductase [Streptomyces sp. SCA4-21]
MSTATPTTPVSPIPVRSPLTSALSGATAVLIGGSSGIGLAAGVLLRSIGARVVLVGRDPDRLEAAVSRVRSAGPAEAPEDAVLAVAGDGGDERTLAAAFDTAGQVDHVLVTAGGLTGVGPLTELSADDIRAAVDSRLGAAFTTARMAASRLPAGGSLTFSSGILVVRPAPGMTAPLSVAGAVETLTRALAVELAPARLRVNAVRFGRIDTPLLRSLPGLDSDDAVAAAGSAVPLGRFGTAEEAAASALFLMANTYVTGQIITVDGGETLT